MKRSPRRRFPVISRAGMGVLLLSVLGMMLYLGCSRIDGGRPWWTLAWLLAVLLGARPLLAGGLTLAWRLTDEGLEQVRYLRPPRRIAWDEIRAVRLRPDYLELTTDQGVVVIGEETPRWVELADGIEQRLGHLAPPPAADQVSPAEVAEWLGLAEGETLICNTPRFVAGWLVGAAFYAALGCWLCFQTWWRGRLHWHDPLIWAWMVTLCFMKACIARQEVCAKPECLEVRTGNHRLLLRLAWGSLWSLSNETHGWLLRTRDGDLMLSTRLSNFERLRSAIYRAIEANQSGQALPRMTDEVPDAALSRAEATVEVDRGLSAAEE
jgi:hypothetical protein